MNEITQSHTNNYPINHPPTHNIHPHSHIYVYNICVYVHTFYAVILFPFSFPSVSSLMPLLPVFFRVSSTKHVARTRESFLFNQKCVGLVWWCAVVRRVWFRIFDETNRSENYRWNRLKQRAREQANCERMCCVSFWFWWEIDRNI